MAKSLNIASWRKASPKELIGFHGSSKQSIAKRKKKKAIRSGFLVVRSQLRPVDIYAYLRARFGVPNGFQNWLRRDDSDNWIHWDFNLKADDVDIYIAGTSRDIHFMIAEEITDQEWKDLIIGLKTDFGRRGRSKSEMTKSFEKFVVFQNKFATLADICAEMHESITNTPAAQVELPETTTKRLFKQYTSA